MREISLVKESFEEASVNFVAVAIPSRHDYVEFHSLRGRYVYLDITYKEVYS